MDASRKATAAGKQRMVAKLTTCSSSPACSVRAPWGGWGSTPLSRGPPLPGQRVSLGHGRQAPRCSPSRESRTQPHTLNETQWDGLLARPKFGW